MASDQGLLKRVVLVSDTCCVYYILVTTATSRYGVLEVQRTAGRTSDTNVAILLGLSAGREATGAEMSGSPGLSGGSLSKSKPEL